MDLRPIFINIFGCTGFDSIILVLKGLDSDSNFCFLDELAFLAAVLILAAIFFFSSSGSYQVLLEARHI